MFDGIKQNVDEKTLKLKNKIQVKKTETSVSYGKFYSKC